MSVIRFVDGNQIKTDLSRSEVSKIINDASKEGLATFQLPDDNEYEYGIASVTMLIGG